MKVINSISVVTAVDHCTLVCPPINITSPAIILPCPSPRDLLTAFFPSSRYILALLSSYTYVFTTMNQSHNHWNKVGNGL